MSVGSELDMDVQDLVAVFEDSDGAGLLHVERDSDDWAENAADVLAQLLRMGWLPPTYTEHVKAKVKQAWEADDNNESFHALQSAADVLGVELVDPHADMAPALGKVA